MTAGFNLSTVFATLVKALPDHRVLIWRGREWTYAQLDARVDGVAHYLASVGLGCHTERDRLQGHESGQDHVGLYLRNGNEYLESMIGAYRARVAPFNVNYRYVEAELRLSAGQCKGSGAGLQRRIRTTGRGDPRPTPPPGIPDPGCRPHRPASAARRRRLRIDRRHTAARERNAHSQWRRPLHPLHRRHHRNAQGCAVAPERHIRFLNGRTHFRDR